MKRGNNPLVLCLFGILPVVWLGLLIAPAAHGGLPEIVARFPAAMSDPFHIELCKDSLKTVLFLLCVYGLAIGIFLSSRRNYRRGEEHGSAKWGSAKTVNKKYRATKFEDNKIFTQNVRMGLDGRKHRRSLNTVVVGGSGAGKTRFYAKPNLCQANTSYVVLDPKGELLRDTGYLLTQKGYEVRVLDLLNMERSHCYNPFIYLRDDNDVQRLVTNLFKSTTPKGSQSNDPFWDTAASMLLLALIFYLKYEAPPEEQNFPMIMEMLRAADVREDTVIIASITSKKDAKPKLPTHYYIGIEAGLELPSIVLLEQLRTVDKRRLNEFIGHLPEKHIQGINHALAVSIGLIDSVPKKLILCLCSTCANNFYGSGAFALRRVDPAQTEKDTCTYCNSRKGFDYEVIPKAR